jgi:hypothetical protein
MVARPNPMRRFNMPTTRERLQATLTELQAALADLDELDPATRERLQTTLHDIRAALTRPAETASTASSESGAVRSNDDDTTLDEGGEQTLAERLNDATRGLESTHPELSTTLGGVINALAQMGI